MEAGLSTIDHKLLISGLFKRCVATTTYDEFWRPIIWSLAAGMSGYYPDADWNDEDLPAASAAKAGLALAGGLFFRDVEREGT